MSRLDIPRTHKYRSTIEDIATLFEDSEVRRFANVSSLNEADTREATEFEIMITKAWNDFIDNGKLNPKEYGKYAEPIQRIVNHIHHAKGVGEEKLIHTGGEKDSSTVSDFWKENAKREPDGTPKCDITTASLKRRLSLKEAGGSQLMSAKMAETLATFRSAEKSMKESGKLELEFKETLEKMKVQILNGLSDIDEKVDQHTQNDVKYALRKVKAIRDQVSDPDDPREIKDKIKSILKSEKLDVSLVDRFHQIFISFIKKDDKIKNSLTSSLDKFFDSNVLFKSYFVFEAASGYRKFKYTAPTANYFLIFNKTGTFSEIKAIGESPETMSSYIRSLAPQIKIKPRWKSGQPALSAYVPKIKITEEFSDIFYEELIESYDALEESLLTEGWIGDLIKNIDIGTVIEKYAEKAWTFIKRMFAKMVDFLDRLIRLGIDYVYRFLGLDIDDVDHVEYNF